MKRSSFAMCVVLVHLVVLGLVRARGELPPPAQDAKPAPADRDLKTWFDRNSPYSFRLTATHVVDGKAEHAPATATGAVTSEGILHLVVPEPPSSRHAAGQPSTEDAANAKTFDLYKLGEILAMKSPSGDWVSFTLHDCEPETINTGTLSSSSSFSRKLIGVVGGPMLPNVRAGTVQSMAFIEDPRSFVHRVVASSKELTDKLEQSAKDPTGKTAPRREWTLDVPKEKTAGMLGVFPVGPTTVTIRVDEKQQVSEIVVSIRDPEAERETDGKSDRAWTLQLSYTSIADAPKEEVPADVVKLLQRAPSGK